MYIIIVFESEKNLRHINTAKYDKGVEVLD